MQATLKGNTFAILQEEKQIFRRKEQKEKALLKREQHRALREAEIESSKKNPPVKIVEPAPTPLKWADVEDDDDDDINDVSLVPTSSLDSNTLHQNSSIHPHMLDKDDLENYDDEDEEEYDEEDDANIPSGNMHTSLTLACACDATKAVSKNHPSFVKSENISLKPHLLSKKERQMAQLRELEELDLLLNSVNIGKSDKNIPPTTELSCPITTTSLTDTTVSSTKSPPTDTIETKSRPKKKNKSKAAAAAAPVSEIPTTSLNSTNDAKDQPNLSLKETVLAMKKAAVNRKNHKSSNPNNVIVESALAEAKKKSEYKKSKQKKEKRFDH